MANELTLNKDKTENMVIGSRQKLINIERAFKFKSGGTGITSVKQSKTLGIIIDNQLLWNKQINVIRAKVSKGIGFFLPKYTLINTYDSLILLHFDYCSLVRDNCSDYLLDKVQKMQNRVARIVTGRLYEARSNDGLKELNWQSLKERIYQKCIFMYKVRNNIYPERITSMSELNSNGNYELRSNNLNLALQKTNTNFIQKSIGISYY